MGGFNRYMIQTGEGNTRGSRTGDNMNQPSETALTTDANGTLTAAMIAGGLITSASKTANRTWTTDTGTLLAAAFPNMDIGDCFSFQAASLDGFSFIVAGGVGVTGRGNLTVPLNTAKEFVLTRTGAATFSLLGL